MNPKYKIYRNRAMTAICSAAFVITLTSCGTNAENKIQDTGSETITETQDETVSTEEIETQTEETENTNADSAAESAISLMLDGAEALKDSASESVNSEAFQNELSNSLQNFKDLSDFIFNGAEINGTTFSELSDEGKEYATDALNSLDETLEYLVPDYKERFSEWLKDKAADGLDLLSELKDKGLSWLEDVQSRRNTK